MTHKNYIRTIAITGAFAAVAMTQAQFGVVNLQPSYRTLYPLPTRLYDGFAVDASIWDDDAATLAKMKSMGFKWIRIDMNWGAAEPNVKGQYDFTNYDQYFTAAQAAGMRTMVILEGGNTLYTGSPTTLPNSDASRAGFAAFAATAARRYAHKGIIWEIGNEPDLTTQTATDYAKMVHSASVGIRSVNSDEWVAAGSISSASITAALTYWQTLLQNGLLSDVDIATVHPYIHDAPETAGVNLSSFRNMMTPYMPQGKVIPLFASEWGYQTKELPFILPPSTFTTSAPNLVASATNFTAPTWKGYCMKPGIQTGVTDPFGGTAATRVLSGGRTTAPFQYYSGLVQLGTPVNGAYYNISCYLRSTGAPLNVVMGINDGTGIAFSIDSVWRRYAYTIKCNDPYNQGRMFQLFQHTQNNPAYDVYGPMVEYIGNPSADQINAAQLNIQGDYVRRMYKTCLATNVPFCTIFQWRDPSTDPGQNGLNYFDGTSKPGVAVLQQCFTAKSLN